MTKEHWGGKQLPCTCDFCMRPQSLSQLLLKDRLERTLDGRLREALLAGTKVWEENAELGANLNSEDEASWALVPFPETHGKVVMVSAGEHCYLFLLISRILRCTTGQSKKRFAILCPGDSHSAALTDSGAILTWGTFRDAGGKYGLSPSHKVSLLPVLSHLPGSPAQAVVKIASGRPLSVAQPADSAALQRKHDD